MLVSMAEILQQAKEGHYGDVYKRQAIIGE